MATGVRGSRRVEGLVELIKTYKYARNPERARDILAEIRTELEALNYQIDAHQRRDIDQALGSVSENE